jgi:hypothetical protein
MCGGEMLLQRVAAERGRADRGGRDRQSRRHSSRVEDTLTGMGQPGGEQTGRRRGQDRGGLLAAASPGCSKAASSHQQQKHEGREMGVVGVSVFTTVL